MLRKVFKTILVLTICLGLTIPTNAAVSVSDGSAFVTKAEFAADLNNLSNRMAQLENSLDAKIDSLVSSYLTRNGIWNGAKQELVLTSGTRLGTGGLDLKNWFTWWAVGNGRHSSDIKKYVSPSQLYKTEYVIINNLNKTGMLFGEWDIPATGSSFYMDVSGMTLNTMYSHEKNAVCFLSFYEVDSSGNENTINRNLIRNLVWSIYGENGTGSATSNNVYWYVSDQTNNIRQGIAGYDLSGTTIGFVSKGNKVVMRIESQFNFSNNTSNSAELFFKKLGNQYMWNSTWKTNGFFVY